MRNYGDDLGQNIYKKRKYRDNNLNQRLGQSEQRALELGDSPPGFIVGFDVLHGQLLEGCQGSGDHIEDKRR